MAIAVVCTCGREFAFEDEYAGQQIKCPDCESKVVVPAAPPRPPQADPAFERETFLIRQKIRIDAKYAVTDEQGNPLLFVVRPTYLMRGLAAILAGMAAGGIWMTALIALGDIIGAKTTAGTILAIVGGVGCLPVFLVVAIALSKLRHTFIYRDETGGTPLVTIVQDAKWQPITQTFTIKDEKGKPLAKLRKNIFTNLIRKKWHMTDLGGRPILTALEDSIWKAFLRRWLGPMLGLLRTNFLLLQGDTEDEIGQFNRKMTILDKYILDLSGDKQRKLDRRLALAMGVMLDTGERR